MLRVLPDALQLYLHCIGSHEMIADCSEVDFVVMVERSVARFLGNRLILGAVGEDAEALIRLEDGALIST